MRVRLRAGAVADLRNLLTHSLTQFGADVAARYKLDIDAVLMRLVDYPELGSHDTRLAGDVRRYPVGEHRIYYRLIDDRVSVGRIWHKRMDAEQHL